jgi:hypothetical protein
MSVKKMAIAWVDMKAARIDTPVIAVIPAR